MEIRKIKKVMLKFYFIFLGYMFILCNVYLFLFCLIFCDNFIFYVINFKGLLKLLKIS